MPFTIVRQDITKMRVDAIVNAANTELKMGGGVSGAIFKAAGVSQLQAACEKLAPIQTGEAVITPGFDLPAKFIIHAVGPVYWQWSEEQNAQLLRVAYTNSLKRAVENNCATIAFPLISSGIYGYPKEKALQVATSAIQEFITDHDIDVTLVVYDKAAFSISRERLGAIESYIDEHYVATRKIKRRHLLGVERKALYGAEEDVSYGVAPVLSEKHPPSIDASVPLGDLVENLDEPFSQMLFRLIDTKEMTDVAVYKRANIDRKLFSKIRSTEGYMPSKRTAIALAIALELSLEEMDAFLKRAGYALSHAVTFDVIVEYFIVNRKYNVFEINEVLFAYDQALLGG